jgi:isopentenyl-diphosphate delta-isomerase
MLVRIGPDGSDCGAVSRALAHEAPGTLHLAVSIQVVDLTRRLWLLQRRAAVKPLFANRWSNTCCTHPELGEDPADAARRRLREETGLTVGRLVPAGCFTYRAADEQSGLVEHEQDFVFVAAADFGALAPDPGEISELALLPFDAAMDLVRSRTGAPWAPDVLERSYAAMTDRRASPS